MIPFLVVVFLMNFLSAATFSITWCRHLVVPPTSRAHTHTLSAGSPLLSSSSQLGPRVAVIGSGASGVFTALVASESSPNNPNFSITVYEKTRFQLSKVKISGGGRCNVLHDPDDFDIKASYPRGSKELVSPLSGKKFSPEKQKKWWEDHGLSMHVEEDGRMFPVSNKSSSVIDVLLENSRRQGVKFELKKSVETISFEKENEEDGNFKLNFSDGTFQLADKVVLATGSSDSGYRIAKDFNHTIVKPVPSLFTFTLGREVEEGGVFADLAGISVEDAAIKVSIENPDGGKKKKWLEERGPLLITHKGLSGPGVLRLSAFAANHMNSLNYKTNLRINFAPANLSTAEIEKLLLHQKTYNKRKVGNSIDELKFIPKRLLQKLAAHSEIDITMRWNEVTDKKLRKLANAMTALDVCMVGKSVFKEEFTTAGGVDLKEVQIGHNYESKKCKNLFFVGEILNIDAVTGGFNFMNCWSSGYVCGSNLLK